MTPGVRRLRIDLSYDGTDFAGWQFQPAQRTVQGVLEAALGKLEGRRSVAARGAGRTDSGAHARNQVADAECRVRLDDDGVAHALRCILPDDIAILRVRTVPADFHSRTGAAGKRYRYALDLSRHGDPFSRRFAAHCPGPFDRAAVSDAMERLPGKRDWVGFASSKCRVQSTVRHLTEATLGKPSTDQRVWLDFAADGFLTHMVRNLVGTLLEIARGRFAPERVDRILESCDRRLAGPAAAARGLHLWRVVYPGEADPPGPAPGGDPVV